MCCFSCKPSCDVILQKSPFLLPIESHEKKSVTWMQVVSENPNDDLRAIDTKLHQLWEATGNETRSEMEALAAQAFLFTCFFHLPFTLRPSVRPSVCPSVRPIVCPIVRPSLHPPVCPHCLFTCLSARLSARSSARLPVCPPACPSVFNVDLQ